MLPLDRLRLEKAATDCGFEMSPLHGADGLVMRSARFPETVSVSLVAEDRFAVSVSDPSIIGLRGAGERLDVTGFGDLYTLLRRVAAHARTRPNRVADAFRAQTAKLPRTTEAERLVVQRVGQGMFRDALLDFWQGRCCITGLDLPELLRASHIRPWSQCETDEQRLDVFNGLLLAPHLDALFDGGWITVSMAGEVVWSSQLPSRARQALGLPDPLQVEGLEPPHQDYLAFHRSSVWRG
jgi:hypothetical protein